MILYLLHRLPWVPKLRSPPATVWKRLGLLLTVSASALLGTLPITLYYFNETSLIGLLVNCVMVPLVGVVVVPLVSDRPELAGIRDAARFDDLLEQDADA